MWKWHGMWHMTWNSYWSLVFWAHLQSQPTSHSVGFLALLHRLLCRFTCENLHLRSALMCPQRMASILYQVCVFFDFQTPISEGLARLLRQPWELALNFHRLSIRQNLNLHNSASPSTLCAATRRKASSNFLQHGSAGPPNLLISKLGALKKLLVPYLKRPCRIGRVHNFEISCYHEDMKASSFKSDSRNISGKILPSSVSSLIWNRTVSQNLAPSQQFCLSMDWQLSISAANPARQRCTEIPKTHNAPIFCIPANERQRSTSTEISRVITFLPAICPLVSFIACIEAIAS